MKKFNQELELYIKDRLLEFGSIEDKRKEELGIIATYINEKSSQNKDVKLNFICTHNSRRSHFGQIWAQTAAYWYDLVNVWTFSGGTEATAFNKRSVAALIRAGFTIENSSDGNESNPIYQAKPGEDYAFFNMFSKKYDDIRNPSKEFAAVMVCSDADENCPLILGAEKRFSLTYKDPKAFDDTEKEAEMYDVRCIQIAREMLYLFSLTAKELITE